MMMNECGQYAKEVCEERGLWKMRSDLPSVVMTSSPPECALNTNKVREVESVDHHSAGQIATGVVRLECEASV